MGLIAFYAAAFAVYGLYGYAFSRAEGSIRKRLATFGLAVGTAVTAFGLYQWSAAERAVAQAATEGSGTVFFGAILIEASWHWIAVGVGSVLLSTALWRKAAR